MTGWNWYGNCIQYSSQTGKGGSEVSYSVPEKKRFGVMNFMFDLLCGIG
jgi:hypothetical protein